MAGCHASILLLNRTEKKKVYGICSPGPHGQESRAKANSITFAAVRLAPIYQGSVTWAQPSRLGLDTKKKFNPAECPDVDYLLISLHCMHMHWGMRVYESVYIMYDDR